MSRYALTDVTNKVQNIMEWDGNTATWQPSVGLTARLLPSNLAVNLGDTYDGTTVTPAPPNPQAVLAANYAAVAAKLGQAINANNTFLAISSPTAGQNAAYIQVVAKELNGLCRLVGGLLDTIADT